MYIKHCIFDKLKSSRGPLRVQTTISTINMDNDDFVFNYGNLPIEIIAHIFRYLNYADRRAAGACCSQWYAALQVNEFKNKTQVLFSRCCLSDESPPAIEYVKTELGLKHFNFVDVTIGDSFWDVMAIIGRTAESLSLDNVKITDEQFYCLIGCLPKLQTLTITRCSPLFMSGLPVNDSDSDRFKAHLSNIRHVDFRECKFITDSIFYHIFQNIHGLKSINMSGTPIAFHSMIYRRFYPELIEYPPSKFVLTFEHVYNVLCKHRNHIESIDLSRSLISGAILMLTDFPLKRVYLKDCYELVTDSLTTFIKSQSTLLELDLSGANAVTDNVLQCIVETNPHLEVLKLQRCKKITNRGVVLFAKLKKLRRLDISGCTDVTSEGITEGIAREKNLVIRELNLSNTRIDENCIKCIACNLTELRVLNLNCCAVAVTDEAIQCVIKNLRWLRELLMEDCSELTDAGLIGISKGKVRKIPLCKLAEEEVMVSEVERRPTLLASLEVQSDERDILGYNLKELRGLYVLNLTGCTKISDASLIYCLQFLELRQLFLSDCKQITSVGIKAFVTKCPSIEELDISQNNNITDSAIKNVTLNLKRLKALVASGCSQLTDRSIKAISRNCKDLKSLNVSRCPKVLDTKKRLSKMNTLRNIEM